MEKQGKNICLEIILDEEHQEDERVARELIYRELAKQFPYTCSCGKIYHTEEQVVRESDNCGAADYGIMGLFQFLINCKCKSTRALELGKENFNTYEIYRIQIAMKSLGEEALKHLVREHDEGLDITQTFCGQYILKNFKYEKQAETILENPQNYLKDSETQIHLGVNLFRDRYLEWMKRRAE
jgi:hypothetical protein